VASVLNYIVLMEVVDEDEEEDEDEDEDED